MKTEFKKKHRSKSYGLNKIDTRILAISFVFWANLRPKMATVKENTSNGPQEPIFIFLKSVEPGEPD